MKQFAVGSVPYLNAKPLIKPLIWEGEASKVKVCLEVPSKLPALLATQAVQAIMVSSVAALTDPTATVAAGLSISTQREVLSVRIFSKVPFEEIESLALDESSLTSNFLARIILKNRFGVVPVAVSMKPNGDSMLEAADACVLIGDNGMAYERSGLHILDLGEEWFRLTRLPFVWAVWKGGPDLDPELVGRLQDSLEKSRDELDRVIAESAIETGFTVDQCSHYIRNIMDYGLDESHLKGLALFGELLFEDHLIEHLNIPTVIHPISSYVTA